MATHITHIVLSDSIYENHFSDCSEKEFMIGTLLPDIRYIDKSISREKYHFKNVSLKTISSLKDCFGKGIYFHSLLDHVRDEFYVRKGTYTPGENEDFIMALKLLEDEILYDKINDWKGILSYIEDFPYENIRDINKEVLLKRYKMVADLIKEKPNNTSRRTFMQNLGMNEEYISRINGIIQELKKEEKYSKLIEELYAKFEALIQNK